jgi:Flp pilus assembly protein TadD
MLLLCAVLGALRQTAAATQSQGAPGTESHFTPVGGIDDSLLRARSLLQDGRVNEAELTVRDYLKDHAHSADAHFLLGYALFRKIQVDAGANRSQALQDGVPSSGDLKSREQNVRASLAEYTEGAKFHAPSAFDLKIVALNYVLLKDYPDADKWLTKSVQSDPKDSEVWYYLGRTKYNENRFEEAITSFQYFLKLEPKSVKGEDNLGLSYQGLGNTGDAIAAYGNAIAWQDGALNQDSGPFVDLGALLLDQNQPDEAVRYLVQAVAISPEESRGHEQLGKAYDRIDQLAKAQAELEQAVELSPQNPRLHYVLGQIYRKEGFSEKAKTEFDRSAELRRDTPSEGRNQ